MGGVPAEGGRRCDGEKRLLKERGCPFLSGGGEGRSEDGEFGSEKEQDKETHLFSQMGERSSSVGMDGAPGWTVGEHWESHSGDWDCVNKTWPRLG